MNAYDISCTVSAYQLGALQKLVTPTTTIKQAAIAKVWCCPIEVEDFECTNLVGALCLMINRYQKKHEIRMYDLENLTMMFQCDVDKDFFEFYHKVNDYFYFFNLVGSRVGFSFADLGDSINFFNTLKNLCYKDEAPDKRNVPLDMLTDKPIPKPVKFEVKDAVKWDTENATFNFDDASEAIESMLKQAGLDKNKLQGGSKNKGQEILQKLGMEFAATGATKGDKGLFAIKGFDNHHAKHDHKHKDEDGGDCKSKCSSEEDESSNSKKGEEEEKKEEPKKEDEKEAEEKKEEE